MSRLTYNEITYDTDDELSGRDFAGWAFLDRRDIDFSGKVIYASVFAHETPEAVVFEDSRARGTTFIRCNLINVLIPADATVIDCLTDRTIRQNDYEQWYVDGIDQPIMPLEHKRYRQLGISIDPLDIPAQPMRESIIKVTMREGRG